MRDRARKGPVSFFIWSLIREMLLAQVKWVDSKDQMILSQRVSCSSPERPTTKTQRRERGIIRCSSCAYPRGAAR
jgi:hypothetical protein